MTKKSVTTDKKKKVPGNTSKTNKSSPKVLKSEPIKKSKIAKKKNEIKPAKRASDENKEEVSKLVKSESVSTSRFVSIQCTISACCVRKPTGKVQTR